MEELGRHLIATVKGSFDSLNDERLLKKAMVQSCRANGATILHSTSYQFAPQGVTAFIMLAESHMSIHTWPEKGLACLDIFTCGDIDTMAILNLFVETIHSEVVVASVLPRGGVRLTQERLPEV